MTNDAVAATGPPIAMATPDDGGVDPGTECGRGEARSQQRDAGHARQDRDHRDRGREFRWHPLEGAPGECSRHDGDRQVDRGRQNAPRRAARIVNSRPPLGSGCQFGDHGFAGPMAAG